MSRKSREELERLLIVKEQKVSAAKVRSPAKVALDPPVFPKFNLKNDASQSQEMQQGDRSRE